MRTLRPLGALALVLGSLSACQQVDQRLPFDLDEGGQTTIGNSGGLISLPPNFSMQVPSGALTTSTNVTAATRLTSFPAGAGVVVSGLMFDVGPIGTQLAQPATVQIAVPTELLTLGQQLSLSIALLTQSGAIEVPTATYDLVNGVLTAQIDELGAVAAVVSADAIPALNLANIPPLGGGTIQPVAPVQSGPAPAPLFGGSVYAASCSSFAQQCFSSGIVQLWVDNVVFKHLGADIILMNTTVNASLEFFNFVGSNPTQVYGLMEVKGDLRTRLNSSVVGRRVDDEVRLFTGNGTSPLPSAVTFSGTNMSIAQTSEGDPEVMGYDIDGIGTGYVLTLRLEGDLEFTDENGNPEIGRIVAHVRLRR
ncbi:MAG: hypothetical protein FJ207_04660 [Gemmatimonadetes bacterium]|nr:hypothetical protein [Gemmatimonadota bacterium]